MGQKGYSPKFRQRALDLLGSGRKVVDVARNLGISDQTIYNWRRQGSKVTKHHDAAQTPTERLVAADVVSPAKMAALRRQRNSLRPASIQREISGLCTQLERLALSKAQLLTDPSTGHSTPVSKRRFYLRQRIRLPRGFDVRQLGIIRCCRGGNRPRRVRLGLDC